jgi:hypothetical protein
VIGAEHGFGLTNHVGDLQILLHHHVISCNELAGLVVVKAFALVDDIAMPCPHGVWPPPAMIRYIKSEIM